MSCNQKTKLACKAVTIGVTLGTVLGACSDIYYDRRDTVALGADDHIAVNRVAQMVDPWSNNVAKKNFAFNGERLQASVERYRRHEVIRPVSPTTQTYTQPPAPITTEAITVQGTTVSAPAAPVK